MRLKTVSKNNETTYGERRRQEEQIQWIFKNLEMYVSPFHGAARNMATGVEMPVSTVISGYSSEIKQVEMYIWVK